MAPTRNARVYFAEVVHDGFPVDGKHIKHDTSQTIDLETEPLNGGILIKTLALSLDPYLRSRLREAHIESYVPPYTLGAPLEGHGVGVIVRSENPEFPVGEHIQGGDFPHQEYFVLKDTAGINKLPNQEKLPWSLFVGVLGMPAHTAYVGWKEFAKPKKGQTVFVSTAAGAVGSVAVQLAKLAGCRVIASSGSDEKAAFAKECGADVSFNYKTTSTEEVLKKEGPIHITYDNVGSETLDLALKYAAHNGQIINCGMITGLNKATKDYAFQNLFEIVGKELSLNGFLVHNRLHRYRDQFFNEIPKLVAEGKFKYQEDRSYGLDKVGEAFVEVLQGKNHGKKVVIVAEE